MRPAAATCWRIKMPAWPPGLIRRIEPGSEMLGTEDHRHALMDIRHELVRPSGDHAGRDDRATIRRFPEGKQAGEGEKTVRFAGTIDPAS